MTVSVIVLSAITAGAPVSAYDTIVMWYTPPGSGWPAKPKDLLEPVANLTEHLEFLDAEHVVRHRGDETDTTKSESDVATRFGVHPLTIDTQRDIAQAKPAAPPVALAERLTEESCFAPALPVGARASLSETHRAAHRWSCGTVTVTFLSVALPAGSVLRIVTV